MVKYVSDPYNEEFGFWADQQEAQRLSIREAGQEGQAYSARWQRATRKVRQGRPLSVRVREALSRSAAAIQESMMGCLATITF